MAENDPSARRLDEIETLLKAVRSDQKKILVQLGLLNQHLLSNDAARRHDRKTNDHRWAILSEVLGIHGAVDALLAGDENATVEIPDHIKKLLGRKPG